MDPPVMPKLLRAGWIEPDRDVEEPMDDDAPTEGRILVVDDEEANVLLLKRTLERAGYVDIAVTTDPREVAGLVVEFEPDLILLDLLMPHLDGFAILDQLRSTIPDGTFLPVIVLTADATRETKQRALGSGAEDFLTKPFDVVEVTLRIKNLLQARHLHLQLQGQNELLEARVRVRTKALEEAHNETLDRLALAAEYRDDDTGQHIRRVGRASALVAGELGLPKADLALIERAAGLHDLGKVGIPDSILLAPRKLTPQEFEVVKTHTVIGANILSGSPSPLLKMAERIAWAHHERWDGSGYAGLVGEDIPLVGRITTVADVFDALTHERPYKRAWPVDEALAEIAAQRGRQFDPQVADAFLSVHEQLDVRDPRYDHATGT
jgi:putative two-component system response regulator